jgi:hypothetical protein
MFAAMNDTKWDALRQAMYELGPLSPSWRTKDLSGYLSTLDSDWFYHFRGDGYCTIASVEIYVTTSEQEAAVEAALRRVHVPGRRFENGFRVHGHAIEGEFLEYL